MEDGCGQAAQLEKARALLGAGKKDRAVKRLLRIVRSYPRTRAAVQAMIILTCTEP